MRWMGRALRALGVEPVETTLFGWAGLCLGLVGAASIALLNSAEALFLKRVGVAYLPLALLANAALLLAATTYLGRRSVGVDRPRWLTRVLVGLALLLVPFVLLLQWDHPAVYAALVLVPRQVLGIGQLTFWLALGDLVTGRQAKRLFAPLTAGFTLGSVAGSFASEPLVRVAGTEGLLVVCAASLAAAGFAAQRLRATRPPRLERGLGRRGDAPATAVQPLSAVWGQSRLFRMLFVAIVFGGAMNPVLYFQFSYAADASTAGPGAEQALLALLASVRGWVNLALLSTQLWVSGLFFRRLGLPLTLAIWPLSYLMGFGWLTVGFGLVAGAVSLGATTVTEDGVAEPAQRVLSSLFPEAIRSRAAGLLGGPAIGLGGVLGCTLVMGAMAVGGAAAIGVAAVPVSAVWLAAVLTLWRAYPTLLLQASAQGGLAGDAEAARLLDRGTIRALGPSLASPDTRICRAAVELVREAAPELAVEALAEAVEQAPDDSRPLIVAALHRLVEPLPPGGLRSPAAAEAIARRLDRDPPLPAEERADLVQVYARLTGGEVAEDDEEQGSRKRLVRALGDPESAVRLAAIAELHRRGLPPPGAPDLGVALRDGLAARDVLMRRTARKELRAMLLSTSVDERWGRRLAELSARLDHRADRAETAEALAEVARRHDDAPSLDTAGVTAFVDDADPRVRAAVLRFAGHAGVREAGPRLVAALASRHPEEAAAARDGLVALGAEAVQPLLLESGFGPPARRDAVVSVMRELELEPQAFDDLYRGQLVSLQETLVWRGALDAPGCSGLLERRLEERIAEVVGGLLALLAARHGDERIAELERRLRRTRDERRRDILVEALEALLTQEEGGELLPLLESGNWAERGHQAADRLGRRPPTGDQALAELCRDRDDLTRRLAEVRSTALEPDRSMDDAPDVLDAMDIAARLQDVPAFDRLATRQLVRLADSVAEEQLAAGEVVYSEGDEGTHLYIVIEGEVALSKQGRELETRGPGSFFGELSTLDGIPRAVSARAASPLRLLALEREDLLTLMEESPELGIGLGQFLCTQVRSLHERLRGEG